MYICLKSLWAADPAFEDVRQTPHPPVQWMDQVEEMLSYRKNIFLKRHLMYLKPLSYNKWIKYYEICSKFKLKILFQFLLIRYFCRNLKIKILNIREGHVFRQRRTFKYAHGGHKKSLKDDVLNNWQQL